MKTSKIVKAKTKAKAKVAAKIKAGKTAAKVAVIVALLAAIVGCASTGEQPARSQTMHNTFDECIIIIASTASVSNRIVRADGTRETPAVEMFTQTQANEGSETISPHASPTNTTDVDAALDVPVNKANSGTSAAGGAAEKLLGAGANWVAAKVGGTAAAAKAEQNTDADQKDAAAKCTGDNCTDSDCKNCSVK